MLERPKVGPIPSFNYYRSLGLREFRILPDSDVEGLHISYCLPDFAFLRVTSE